MATQGVGEVAIKNDEKVTRGRESLSIVIIVTHSVLYTYHLLYFFIFLNHNRYCLLSEAVARRCSVKKVFLEISQNSQEKTCTRVFLIKFQAPPAISLKKRLWHRCLPVNFAKFLRTPLFIEHLRRLLLPCVNFFKF